ncbi:MAG: DNA primase [Candidatus Vogelbacteria bacterium]|nr:DNA primase [Candidatus Vogelbacteria bacterium]
MSSSTEQIKAKLSIAEVVGSYLKLEKAGGNFKARCPFHNEKTPSFYVSPSRESWHCFGCNRGGDIFSFVEEVEGLDFLGALEVLAGRAGVELGPVDLKVRSETERLYALIEEATRYFHTNLLQSEEAKQYLKDRQIKEETVRRFRLGFAKSDWNALSGHLVHKGFKEEEIEKAGLAIASSQSFHHAGGRYYDRFRGRVMFPLCDGSGRVVGFSGRIIMQNGEREEAKYINTPQTALYDKSRVLFGYDKAKQEIRKNDFCVLVEGQMDLISSHQAGVENAVAVSGTALTAQHLALIKRLTDNLVMAFDGDSAGIAAARRGIELALSAGLDVKIALLPDGLDPADLVAQAEDKWKEAIAGATNVVDFYLGALGRKTGDKRLLNKRIVEEVLPYVARYQNSIDRAQFVGKIAAFVGTKDEPIWNELEKIRVSPTEALPAVVGPEKKSRSEMIEGKVFSLLFWLEGKGEALGADLRSRLTKDLGELFEQKEKEYSMIKDRLILEAELSYEGNEFLSNEADDLLANLAEEKLREELEIVLGQLRQTEAIKNETEAGRLLAQAQDLRKKIEEFRSVKAKF